MAEEKKKKAKREGGEKARVWDFCEIAWTSVTTITSRKKKKQEDSNATQLLPNNNADSYVWMPRSLT